MLTEVFSDMIYFIVIFFIGVTAFADAFGSIDYIVALQGYDAGITGYYTEEDSFYTRYIQQYFKAW